MTPLITRIEISEQTAASFESCRAVALRTAQADDPGVTSEKVKWSTTCDAMGWTMVVQWLPTDEAPEPERLWGLPGSETMFSDPIELYDAEVEPWLTDATDSGPWEAEEWSVRPTVELLPSSLAILEWIADWVFDNGEVDEGFRDNYIAKTACDEVIAAGEALRQAIASKITYRMADEKIADWVLTRDPETDNPVVKPKSITFYLATCQECGNRTVPFYGEAERDQWSAVHRALTHHTVIESSETREATS